MQFRCHGGLSRPHQGHRISSLVRTLSLFWEPKLLAPGAPRNDIPVVPFRCAQPGVGGASRREESLMNPRGGIRLCGADPEGRTQTLALEPVNYLVSSYDCD